MKTVQGEVQLMKSVLLRKKKLSPRFWLFTIGFPDSPSLKIEPGNHINVFPDNDPEHVKEILTKMNDMEEADIKKIWDSEYPIIIQKLLY